MMKKFDEFNNDRINESYKDISLLQKAWSKYYASIYKSMEELSEVKQLLRTISNTAPTVAQKEMAYNLYDSIDGSLQFVLTQDRDSSVKRYTNEMNSKIETFSKLPSKEEKVKVGKLPDSIVEFGITPNTIIAVKRILDSRKITNGYFGDSLSGTYLMQGNAGQSAPNEFYSLRKLFKSSHINEKDKQKFKTVFLKSTGYNIDFDTYGNVTFKK